MTKERLEKKITFHCFHWPYFLLRVVYQREKVNTFSQQHGHGTIIKISNREKHGFDRQTKWVFIRDLCFNLLRRGILKMEHHVPTTSLPFRMGVKPYCLATALFGSTKSGQCYFSLLLFQILFREIDPFYPYWKWCIYPKTETQPCQRKRDEKEPFLKQLFKTGVKKIF